MEQTQNYLEPEKRKLGRPKKSTVDISGSILRAAFDLFSAQNYSSVTIKDISSVAGVNSSMISYYFGGKEELFLKVIETTVETAFERFNALKPEDKTPVGIITSWIEIHVDQFLLLQKLATMSLDYSTNSNRSARVDKAISSGYDNEIVLLSGAIRRGVEQGIFRQVDAKQTAIFISTYLDGCLFRSVMFPTFKHKLAIKSLRAFVLEHLARRHTRIPHPK